MASYFAAPSIHWCRVNGFCIVLDAENDRYLHIPLDPFQALSPFLSTDDNCDAPDIPAALAGFAEELLSAGILTRVLSAQSRLIHPSIPSPRRLLHAVPSLTALRGAARVFPRFLRACASADYSLRCTTMSRIAKRISSRNLRQYDVARAPATDSVETLSRAFHVLRPLYPRNYLCLFDCLALLEFLALWQIFPSWVFGVSADPFEAHCWVQDGDLVLCDTVDFSAPRFERIMVL